MDGLKPSLEIRMKTNQMNRYQVVKNKSTHPPTRFSVVDTEGTTLGERYICATDTEQKANQVASALNEDDDADSS